MFGFLFKSRRRRRLVAQPFPDAWETVVQHNVQHWAFLDDDEQRRLRDLIKIFVAEKTWEFCGGLTESDEAKVTVAAQACLLTLNLDVNDYPNVTSIILYPSGYFADDEEEIGEDGFIVVERSARLGEAHTYGPVVLAWDEVKRSGRRPTDGTNLVYHEFAHKLDMLAGDADGFPELPDRAAYERWREVMRHEYQRLCDRADRGQRTLLDPYGCENAAEFFAVAVECFFDRPQPLEHLHPELYEVLRDYFRQDPAKWARRREAAQ